MKNKLTIAKIVLTIIAAAALTINISSCHQDKFPVIIPVTETVAAQLATDAVIPGTGGMLTQVYGSTAIYKAVKLSCGVQKDSTIIVTSAAGASPSFNYNLASNYTLTCAGAAPSQVAFFYTGNLSYSGPLMSSVDKSAAGFILTGLGTSSTQYTFSSNYSRNGTTTSKIGQQNTFTSIIAIQSNGIIVDKTAGEIVSGTATISIKTTSSAGTIYTFNGTITFLGNRMANLVLTSGTVYPLSW
jgi:hypothetical protein